MSNSPFPHQADTVTLGAAVRRARQRLGLSVEGLAEQSGVSTGQISQVERGLANPSLKTMDKVATALGTTVASLLSRTSPEGVTVVRSDQRTDLPLPDQPEGYRRELLTPPGLAALQVIRTVLPEGYTNQDSPYRHLGYESVTVLQGRLQVVVGTTSVVVEAGDTINYECSTAHYWANAHPGETIVQGCVIPVQP
ncbi:helix-turn-helix domain-containing protein [Propionibacteriaceae bacterium Y1923]